MTLPGPASRGGALLGAAWKRLPAPRLKHAILGAVLWSLILAEIAVLAPAIYVWHGEEIARIEAETLNLLKANVDITTFPTVAATVKIGERLATFSHVRGGIIANAVGDEVAVFGERPLLTPTAARQGNIRSLSSPDRARLDVLYPTDVTGLAHTLVLRLDASHVPGVVLSRLIDKGLVILAIALVSGIAVAILLSIWIVRPVIRLRDAAIVAADNPDKADRHRLRWTRSDELGEAARAFDLLLTAVSIIHQEDLAANQEAMQRSSHAVLTYDPAGRLIAANAAALRLFGADGLNTLSRQGPNYVRVPGEKGDAEISPLELIGPEGDVARVIEIQARGKFRQCHLNAATIRRRNGTVLRHVVTLFDLGAHLEPIENACRAARESASALQRRIGEMRQLFESCLLIMAEPPGSGEGDGFTEKPRVSVEKIVNGWYADAAKNDLVGGEIEHGVLPAVFGEPQAVEAAFRQALLLVYTRSRAARPRLSVEARPMEGRARFEVGEIGAPANSVSNAAPPHAGPGAAIAARALARALAEAGGEDLDLSPAGQGNAVTFTLSTERKPAPMSFEAIVAETAARDLKLAVGA